MTRVGVLALMRPITGLISTCRRRLLCTALVLGTLALANAAVAAPATPTPTPRLTATNTPYPPQLGLFLNQEIFHPGDIFALNLAASNTTEPVAAYLRVYLEIIGLRFYWPTWDLIPLDVPLTVAPDLLMCQPLLLLVLPYAESDASGVFHAQLFADDGGVPGALIEESSAPFVFDAPTPQPTPTPTPLATATPTPTEVPPTGWISGYAEVYVSGAAYPPTSTYDKGVMFSLDGINCETAWVRHRNRSGQAQYQAKMTGNTNGSDECWDEINYYDMLPAADGIWRIQWGVEDGGTWVKVTAPNGTSEYISVHYTMAFDHITAGAGPCPRPSTYPRTSATVRTFEPGEPGHSDPCW